MSNLTVEVLAERLDNHLEACAIQNVTVLEEIRALRSDIQPIITLWQAGGVSIRLIKLVALIATAITAVGAAVRFWPRA